MQDLRVNGDRLWQSLMEMAQFGLTEKGGCARLAATELDGKARDLFVDWCKACGCTVSVDKMGNIFARREGKNNSLPAVATGSHLDTQPTGGKFDGVFGVLAGVEVLRTLHDNNIVTETPMEFTVWTNEEGSRFQPAMQGSGVYVGRFNLETELNKTDVDGIRLKDELEKIGYLGKDEPGSRNIGAFFETHIEQGPILEDQGKTIGVVRLGQGIRWYNVTIKGRESHSGTTPMYLRNDAMVASAKIITEVEQIANRYENGLGTVGFMQVFPNSRNVIPGEITLSVDLRNPNADTLAEMDSVFTKYCESVAKEREIQIDIDPFWYFAPVEFNASDDVKSAAEKLGYSNMDIYAGAGHDACYMADLVPTGMIFTPCENGISHNEIENTSPQECEAGANVLLHTMLEASERIAKESVGSVEYDTAE
ncbi:hydantoinase/carbamoylase family amidase [Vibrio sp. OCN044]|uniref:Hydantoinase/carbamoylase family amidase n=1 Tax=Vibrio tetraodonis subsp. pristinus TaxID=2695891 RepID=A0A6L8LPB4_9VIBR|nr:Zn-dependent hydrolase [Vibrio tetraodonis]MYM57867.1 hydantoinase/carbamoylase family amidase [Vibrio tetraodonis subsp. pristinus]